MSTIAYCCDHCGTKIGTVELDDGSVLLLHGYRLSDRGPYEMPRHAKDRVARGQRGTRQDAADHPEVLERPGVWRDPAAEATLTDHP